MSLHPSLAAGRPRLAVGQAIRASYRSVFAHRAAFFARLAPWYTVVVAITVARLLQGMINGFDTSYMMWLGRAHSGAEFLGVLFFAVHWNRVVLLREGIAQAPLLSLRALRFLAMGAVCAALVVLFATGAVGLIAIFGDLRGIYHAHLGLVLLLLLVFGAARLLPTLALASVDYRGSELIASLRLTRGYGLALFQGIFAVAIPALVGRSVMTLLARMIDGPVAQIVFQMLATACDFLAVGLVVSFGAYAYIALSRLAGAELADHRA